jgi:hypothetical protein
MSEDIPALANALMRARHDPELMINPSDAEDVGWTIQGDWWSAHLLRLIAKSDPAHRAALALVFPSHVEAYERWHKGVVE